MTHYVESNEPNKNGEIATVSSHGRMFRQNIGPVSQTLQHICMFNAFKGPIN